MVILRRRQENFEDSEFNFERACGALIVYLALIGLGGGVGRDCFIGMTSIP